MANVQAYELLWLSTLTLNDFSNLQFYQFLTKWNNIINYYPNYLTFILPTLTSYNKADRLLLEISVLWSKYDSNFILEKIMKICRGFAVSMDHGEKMRESKKRDKYFDRELIKLRKIMVTVIPVVIGALPVIHIPLKDHQQKLSWKNSQEVFNNNNINQQKKNICKIVDFAVPTDQRIKLKVIKKKDKYFDLARELKKLWNMKVTIVPIVIGALGTITKGLLKGLEDLEVGGRVETIQTTALLRTARILRRVLETWGDLLSLRPQGKNNQQTLMWKTLMSKNNNNDKNNKKDASRE